MKNRSLQSRFMLAGILLVAATVVSSVWSAFAFVRLNGVVTATLRESQETIDLSAEIHGALEREDDALLLFVTGDVGLARRDLAAERHREDDSLKRLLDRLRNNESAEREIAIALLRSVNRYRIAGDELLSREDQAGGAEHYHRVINPLLREAVAECDELREANFRAMQQTGIRARDESARGSQLIAVISILTILLGIGVAVWLARSILVPVRQLTESVDAIREGNFERRVNYANSDELGQLSSGFNRMAGALAQYRQSNLGEILAAKTTLEATLNALPDAVLVFARDASLAALNPPAKRLLSALGVGLVKSLSETRLPDEYRTTIEAALTGSSPGTRSLDFGKTLNVSIEGQSRRFILTAIPIPEFVDGCYGAVAVLHDVTEFARLDELRSELIGVASHELKSPLTTLRMNLLMLGEEADQLSCRQQELLSTAVSGCEELSETIEELLDVTRIEAGQLRLNVSQIDLHAVLSSVTKALRTRFEDAGVELVIERDPATAQSFGLPGDHVRLASVFANVLGNALKYSPTGGRVTVQMLSRHNAPSFDPLSVQVAVTDQGPGVPAEFRERIFEKFFRVEHHMRQHGKHVRGTGIGLYLCREIIKAHNGSITCEAGPSRSGTLIAISLPAAAS